MAYQPISHTISPASNIDRSVTTLRLPFSSSSDEHSEHRHTDTQFELERIQGQRPERGRDLKSELAK